MDSLTHALIGTAIAEVGFRSKLGRCALLAGTVYATLPDLDIFFSLSNPTNMIKYHRAASHSIFIAFIAAPILGWIGWKLGKKTGKILQWSLLALLSLLSHDILDLFTSWGTEVLYPFSNARYAYSALPIVDPLITLPLVGLLLTIFIMKNFKIRRIIAMSCLIWCITYACIGLTFSHQAIILAEQQKPKGFNTVQSQAVASIGTILLWHVALKDSKNNFFIAEVQTLKNRVFNQEYLEPITDSRIEQVLKDEDFEIHRRSSRDMLLPQKKAGYDDRITFRDMRYALINKSGKTIPLFWTDVIFNKNGTIKNIERVRGDTKNVGDFNLYWNRIFN